MCVKNNQVDTSIISASIQKKQSDSLGSQSDSGLLRFFHRGTVIC